VEESGAFWNPATTRQGWFANPDNMAVDGLGRLWVTSDQGSVTRTTGTTDGFWALETEGELRGTGRLFYRVPIGAELCGPCFTPDSQSLFLAIQHVAKAAAGLLPGFDRKSSFEDPVTRWPDFDPSLPPRPSVVVITESKGRAIGA
jgi:secreted PhoX family phosphatase